MNTSKKNCFNISNIDHIVLTVKNIEKTAEFYTKVMGMKLEYFGPNQDRVSLKFGIQKINLHQYHCEFKPHANQPTPGSIDICFITEQKLTQAMEYVHSLGIPIEEGPIQRTGARGPIQSFYFRDPDGNLIEVANYL